MLVDYIWSLDLPNMSVLMLLTSAHAVTRQVVQGGELKLYFLDPAELHFQPLNSFTTPPTWTSTEAHSSKRSKLGNTKTPTR